MSNVRQVDRATGFLPPPSVDQWLPDRDLARLVVEVIEQLDFAAMVKAHRGSKSASLHPGVLFGLLVYGSAKRGVFEPQDRTGETQLKAEVAELMALAEAADGADLPDGMSMPEELARREQRLARIAAAEAGIEARTNERPARQQADFATPLFHP